MGVQGDRAGQLHLICSDRGDGLTCVAVAGDIDMSTGDTFRRTLTRHLREPGLHELRLDLGSLSFIDSNGVAVLIGACRVADERDISFGLINAPARIRSVLELMGVYDMLTVQRRLP
jgi:anti-anti-sigma factor